MSEPVDITRRRETEAARELRNELAGRYSTPRRCFACQFKTQSRQAFWFHWFSEHGGLGKP